MKIRTTTAILSAALLLTATSLSGQTVLSGDITVDTDLGPQGAPADTEYIISGTLRVYGTDGTDGITTLSIEPGVTIKFNPGSTAILQIGHGADPGCIKAEGSEEEEPIYFTSAKAIQAKGDWRYINLTASAKNCLFDYTIVEFGGMSQGYGTDAAILTAADTLTMKNSRVRNSGTTGITVLQNTSYIFLDGLSLENNTYHGLATGHESAYSVIMNDCNILSNGFFGLDIKHNITLQIQNSSFDPNGFACMILHPNLVGGIDGTNSFTAPGQINVISGDITREASWPGFFSDYGVHYHIDNHIKVYGTADVPSSLTIGEGAELRFVNSSNSILQVGANADPGNLFVHGTADKPVKFTSAAAEPAPGDWRYINLTSTARKCILENVIIEYGGKSQGYGDDASLKTEADSLIMSDVTINTSGAHGMSVRSHTNHISADKLNLENNTFNGMLVFQNGDYSISLNNSSILSNGHYGLNIPHDIEFSIKNSAFDSNTLGIMRLYPNLVGGVDNTNTFTSPGLIEVLSGDITTYAFWPGFFNEYGVYYYINNALRVYGTQEFPTTLSIGEGAELRFKKSAGSVLQVGSSSNLGNLFVHGTADKPVKFTSVEAEPAPGDWRYIYLTSAARKCILENTIIEYSGKSQGYGDDASIKTEADSLILSDVSIKNSGAHGMSVRSHTNHISADMLSIENSAYNGMLAFENGDYSINLNNSSILSNGHYGLNIPHDIEFSLQNSAFDSNTLGIMRLYPNIVGGVANTNTFTAPGLIEIISGDITKYAFWPGFFNDYGVYYYINNALRVYGTQDFATTLSIGEGAELRFKKSAGSVLQVGANADPGNLFVHGTADKPVKFTSAAVEPAPGDWRYLHFTSTARKCILENTIIEYSGKPQGYGDDASIKTEADSLIMSDVMIKNSGAHGISVRSHTNHISADKLRIENSAYNGMLAFGNGDYSINLNSSKFLSNGQYGLNIPHDISFNMYNSVFDPNTSGTMVLHPNIAGGVDSTNSFTEPGLIEVISGDITKDAFWPGFFSKDSVYYYINNSLKLYGTPEVAARLEISKGSEIRFKKSINSILQVGHNENLGTLIAKGSAENPVTFTSAETLANPGDWRYIFMTPGAVDCMLEYVLMTYGGKNQGYGSDATLRIESSSPSIVNCRFSLGNSRGIFITGEADPYTFNNTFTENSLHGVLATSLSNDIDFSYNNFTLNMGAGCQNDDDTEWTDASYSFWGSEDGPSGIGPGTGDEAIGQVIIDPWSSGLITAGIDLNADTDSLSYMESRAKVHVITGLRWIVSSGNDWVSFEPAMGTKVDSFTVEFAENPSADPRIARINVSSGDTLTQTLEITQPGAPPVFSHDAPATIDPPAGILNIALQTNYSWTISSDCDWADVSPAEGYFDETITVSYGEHNGPDTRTCNLTVTGGGLTEVITLSQLPYTSVDANESLAEFDIYPNPVSGDQMVISTNNAVSGSANLVYSLIDLTGKTILEGKLIDTDTKIDISGFQDGLYLIVIKNSERLIFGQKILIQKK